MDLRFTDQETAFREEVRSFCRENLPQDIRRKCAQGQRLPREDVVRWTRMLHAKGWATPSWPKEWGGPGWNAVQQFIFNEELYLTPAPEPLTFNANMIGPTLIAFGTEEQKRHFLPKIATLDYWFCQGFSEPGSGSDLASLRTTAVREGDHYLVNGQKTWTSLAHHADWCFLLVRTDPDVKKQRGISYLLMDMASPGVTVRPLISIDGCHEFNEVFLDNVRIPVANLVGEENKGWDCAKYLLSHERTGVARVGLCKWRVQTAKQLARKIEVAGGLLSEQPSFCERLTEIEIELKALEILQMVVISENASLPPGVANPKTSILKIRGSELQQSTTQLLLDIAGYDSMEFDHGFVAGETADVCGEGWARTAAPNHFWLRHTTISGGTNEIQRNILAKSVLGL